jgi:hypothetical protein
MYVAAKDRKRLLGLISLDRPKINLFLGLLLILLGFDYVLTLAVGNYLGGDTNFHLAKILKTLIHGPSIIDPLIGVNPEIRYHYSLIHVVYALGSKITGLSPLEFWRYSASFFRLFYWLASLALLTFFFQKRRLSYLLMITFFFINFYPIENQSPSFPNATQIFLLFVIAAIVLMKYFREGQPLAYRNSFLLIAEFSALLFLIGFSHPLYSLLVISFLCVVLAIFLILKFGKFVTIIPLVPGMIVSLLFPLYSFFLPRYFKHDWYGLNTTKFVDFFRGKILAVQFNQGQIDATLILLILGILLSMLVLQDEIKKSFLITILIFPFLVLNTPLLTLLMRALPFWAIERISFLDIFSKVLIFLPFFWALRWFKKGIGSDQMITILTLSVLFLLVLPFLGNIPKYTKYRTVNQNLYASMKEIESFKELVRPGKLVITHYDLSIIVPDVLDAYILSLDQHSGHWNPATPDIKERSQALEAFFNGNTKKVKKYLTEPTYVLIAKNHFIPGKLKKKLKLIKSTENFLLFKLAGLHQ